MTDPIVPTTPPADGSTPSSAPGERRLARPPSERYRVPEPDEATVRPTSVGRGLATAAAVAIVGALAITVLGGVLTLTGGLLVAAAVIGWGEGWAAKVGAGATLTARRRSILAAAVALAAVAAGQVGLWLYAGTEGGVLSLADYLGATFGPLVPLQAVIAPAVAWMTAR